MWVRFVALLLTVLTGFSGLVYEVAWQRYLATLLGSQSEATASVLAIFLGGLAAGYAVFGVVARKSMAKAAATERSARLLRSYGVVEMAIGAYALVFPWTFRAGLVISAWLSPGGGPIGFAVDLAITALLLGPPTMLMGGTIPLLTQALASTLQDATRFHALVYCLNTAGAFFGALSGGLLLVPWLGLDDTVRWMGLVNLVAGASFLALDRGAPAPGPVAPRVLADPKIRAFAWLGGAALLVGFAMMAIQTVLIRLGGLALGPSQAAFSMVVAVFVLCIALGSLVVSLAPRIPAGSAVLVLWVLVAVLLALYPHLQDLPYFMHQVRSLFRSHELAFQPYNLACFTLLLALLAIPVGLSGSILPLLFHALRREMDELGSVAGRLYAWNTLGSLLGALLGGYLLLRWVDLHHVYRIAVVALAIAASFAAARLLPFGPAVASGVVLLLVLLFVAQADPWNPRRTTSGVFRIRQQMDDTWKGADRFFASWRSNYRLLFFDDDPDSTVSVMEYDDSTSFSGFQRALFTNGKPDTQVPLERRTVVSLAVFPCLFVSRCERAFVVGLGTGTTAGELAQLDDVEEVVVAEISSGVIEALPVFGFANHQLHREPKLRVRRSDAYRTLLRDETQYDVISSEPSNPWVTGIENLFSVEFLRAAKARLRPGGVYAQWVQGYEISPATFHIVLRTFASVFDNVAVWSGSGSDMILICSDGPSEPLLDVAHLAERARRPTYAAALARAGIEGIPALLASELLPLGLVHSGVSPGPMQSLFRPILNRDATRDFFLNASVELRASAERSEATLAHDHSLLARFVERNGGRLSDEEWATLITDVCPGRRRECVVFLAWWSQSAPESRTLSVLRERSIAAGGATSDEIALVATLFGAGDDRSPVPGAIAAALSQAYVEYFHPAAPFRESALASVLDRCRDDENVRCAEIREATEATIGPLALGGRRP